MRSCQTSLTFILVVVMPAVKKKKKETHVLYIRELVHKRAFLLMLSFSFQACIILGSDLKRKFLNHRHSAYVYVRLKFYSFLSADYERKRQKSEQSRNFFVCAQL